jgi:aminoglycoside 6'-N-acetyltransferase I
VTSVRLLGPGDAATLEDVAPDVFDHAIDPGWTAEFLADPRHHIAVAIDGGRVVGMASALHYVHPDKAPALFVNEVGVAASHRQRGLGKQLLAALFERGRELGCTEAWVGTELSNSAARRLYLAAGGKEAKEPFLQFTFPLAAGPKDGSDPC